VILLRGLIWTRLICESMERKRSLGFAHRFRPTYAGANVGHPSISCGIAEIGTQEQRPRLLSRPFGLSDDDAQLLGGHFFGFAFLPHEFQFALGFLEGGRDFLLHTGSGLFKLLRELDVAVVLHARSGRDEATDDDVFLEAAQAVDRAVDAGFGEYTRGIEGA
jgi:hypothetical protein